MNRKLIINTALAALAAGVGAFVTVMQTTDDPLSKAALISAATAAGYAVLRFVYGLLAANVAAVPTIPVDK